MNRTPTIGRAGNHTSDGLAAGVAAGLAMVAFTVAIRAIWDTMSIPELAADRITSSSPGTMAYGGLLAVQVGIGGGVGAAYGRFAGGRRLTTVGESS